MDSIIFNLLGDGKPTEIKKLTVISEKKKTQGLRLTDFNIMNKAVKVSWIPRM